MVVSLWFGVLFGLLLFNALTHIQIAFRSGWTRRQVSILALTASVALYAGSTLAQYRIDDVDIYFYLIRVQSLAVPVFFTPSSSSSPIRLDGVPTVSFEPFNARLLRSPS